MEQESNRKNEDELREELMQDHYERMLSEYAV